MHVDVTADGYDVTIATDAYDDRQHVRTGAGPSTCHAETTNG